MILLALSIALAWWIAANVFFTFGALRAVRRFFRTVSRGADRQEWPAIVVLRPCEGADPGLEENLVRSATAPYPGERTVCFTVPSREDAAYPILERAAEAARRAASSVKVVVLVVPIDREPNRKAAQLAAAAREYPAPIVVQIDSTVRLGDETLTTLVHTLLEDPAAGAAYAPPVEHHLVTAGDYASTALLTSTPHAFYVLAPLSAQLKGPKLLAGKLIAHRAEVLAKIGGFQAQTQFLGEDMELTRLLFEGGYSLAVSPAPAICTDERRPLGSILKRYARWSMVVRRQRPWLFFTYPMFLGATPLVLVCAGLAVLFRAPYWQGLLAGACVLASLRTLLAAWLRPRYGLPGGPIASFLAMMAGEFLIDVTSTMGWMTDSIEWRGRRYRVGERGALEPQG